MQAYRVTVKSPHSADSDQELVLIEEHAVEAARSAALAVMPEDGAGVSDWLVIEVEPEDADAPPFEVPDIYDDYWEDVEPREVAVNRETGEVRRWDPDTVARKGLAPGWAWLEQLTPFEVFQLLHLRQPAPGPQG